MNKHQANKQNIDRACLLLLKTLKANQGHQQQGYAMLVTAVLAIIIFSLLSISLFSSRLYKSSAT
jgi:hypothetical protein